MGLSEAFRKVREKAAESVKGLSEKVDKGLSYMRGLRTETREKVDVTLHSVKAPERQKAVPVAKKIEKKPEISDEQNALMVIKQLQKNPAIEIEVRRLLNKQYLPGYKLPVFVGKQMEENRRQATLIVERLFTSRGGRLAPLVHNYLKIGASRTKTPEALDPQEAKKIAEKIIQERKKAGKQAPLSPEEARRILEQEIDKRDYPLGVKETPDWLSPDYEGDDQKKAA